MTGSKRAAPEVRVKDIRGNAYLYSSKTETLRDLDAGGGHLSLTVELFGDYDSVQAFAQDCLQGDRCRAAVQCTAGRAADRMGSG